jgi:hypothetical protein
VHWVQQRCALSRELKANAHLFCYFFGFFADRHDIQENETMKLT